MRIVKSVTMPAFLKTLRSSSNSSSTSHERICDLFTHFTLVFWAAENETEPRFSTSSTRIIWSVVKTQILSHSPRTVGSVRLGWDLRICISNKFPGDAAGAHPGSVLRKPLAGVLGGSAMCWRAQGISDTSRGLAGGGCRILRCPREQSSVKQIISLKSRFFHFFNGNNEIYSVKGNFKTEISRL